MSAVDDARASLGATWARITAQRAALKQSEGTTSAQRINRLPLPPRCSYGGICHQVGGAQCAELCRAQRGES